MLEVNILFGLALVWIIFASVSDLRTREIFNWLNFSLAIFALGIRFFYSLFELNDFNFFYVGIIGFLAFYVLGEFFYSVKMFAGGDTKLMQSLGAIIPIFSGFYDNLQFVLVFLLLFLFSGAIYGFIVSGYFGLTRFDSLKKEIKKQFNNKKKMIFIFLILGIFFMIGSFFISSLFFVGILSFIFPYLYLFFHSVDESCMVKEIHPLKLTVGDWLHKDVKVGNKIVQVNWDGLEQEEINILIKNNKKVFVKYGIPFAPVFLISFSLLWVSLNFNILELIINLF